MANHINLDYSGSLNFLTEAEISSYSQKVSNSNALLYSGKGKGSDFLGWLDLPASTAKEAINKIKNAAEKLKEKSKFIVVIGIGGSYLGARAVIDALSDNMNFSLKKKERENPLILYAGQNISEDYLADMLKFLENRDYSLIVISKSGTTTEPALAFRLFKKHLIYKYGKNEAKERILSVTGKEKGALKKLSDAEGYETFAIPDDIGGRFSVLTPVGLLPIAAAGINIDEILEGAKYMQNFLLSEKSLDKNSADLYAVLRNLLYSKGKMIEILANYNPSLNYFTEWWKQLYGESEGKEGKGIFPVGVNNTTDLHSMGQMIQEGTRNIFETVIWIEKTKKEVEVPYDDSNLDEINYLAGKRINEINEKAMLGTVMAHIEGGVPNLRINIPELNGYYLGEMIYFFEKACAVSGYLLDVNPFNQPGVEAYKKNMFQLLGK
ncbi:MAG TPA: glucose-6-phosphate isomerase [Ignavibacteria bacterium]